MFHNLVEVSAHKERRAIDEKDAPVGTVQHCDDRARLMRPFCLEIVAIHEEAISNAQPNFGLLVCRWYMSSRDTASRLKRFKTH
jgi:hypothetical protein